MRTVLLLVGAALLAACATGPKMPTSLEEHVQARWDALLMADYQAAYGYLTPGYRSSVSLPAYRARLQRRAINWTSAKYESKNCEDERCAVTVAVGYKAYLPQVGQHSSTRSLTETWLLVDDAWYYLPSQ